MAEVRSACKPEEWTVMAVAELSDVKFVNKASPFLHWLSSALDGDVDIQDARGCGNEEWSYRGSRI